MRTLVLVLLSIALRAQQLPSCNLSGNIPGILVPPFSTINFSLYATMNQTVYICGPNAVAYDTLGAGYGSGPNAVFVDSGATYISKESDNLDWFFVAVKNGGTLILLLNPDSNAAPTSLYVTHEPFATIINNSGFGYQNVNCSFITFPTVNCGTATQLGSMPFTRAEVKVELVPNPVNDYLEILLSKDHTQKSFWAEIFNAQGLLLRKEYVQFEKNRSGMPVSGLEPGFYVLRLHSQKGNSIQKGFIVAR